MHTSHGPRPDPLTDLGYEAKDVNMRKIGMATAFFFGFFTLCVFLTWFYIHLVSPQYFDQRADIPQLQTKIPKPPNPLLQTDVTVRTDMQDLRRAETEAMTNPKWVDQSKGIARIPVDRAMQMIAERGNGQPTMTGNTTTAPTTTAPKANGE
jgi:hypothetical protein